MILRSTKESLSTKLVRENKHFKYIMEVHLLDCISVSAMDALQWMGAVRMRVW